MDNIGYVSTHIFAFTKKLLWKWFKNYLFTWYSYFSVYSNHILYLLIVFNSSLFFFVCHCVTPPPPNSHRPQLMFYKIIHTEPTFPKELSPEARGCCAGLLTVSEVDRLGSGESGAQDIMDTPFFQPIDFSALLEKTLPPPFVPEVRDEVDTKYVPKAYLKAEAKDSIAEPSKGEVPNFEAFTFSGESVLDA